MSSMEQILPYLPVEIRQQILYALLQDGDKVAKFATVSRDWQDIVEQHTFARIRLTPPRIMELNEMTHRTRHLVRHLWLCVELELYGCESCAPQSPECFSTTKDDNAAIVSALGTLFSAVSTWDASGEEGLSLDISVYSPSDSQHALRHLSIQPDEPLTVSHERTKGRWVLGPAQSNLDTRRHGWAMDSIYGGYPNPAAVQRLFGPLMTSDFFESEEHMDQWWRELPSARAITSLSLRQQNLRRWGPRTVARLVDHLPGLQSLFYEPWREWSDWRQALTDKESVHLFKHLAMARKLRTVSIFENFNPQFAKSIRSSEYTEDLRSVRAPSPHLSCILAIANHVEKLSASFLVNAVDFFTWVTHRHALWPSLTTLTLTSRALSPDKPERKIMRLLRQAAVAALDMPRLEVMELWHGANRQASVFRYKVVRGKREEGREWLEEPSTAVVTWRATWELELLPSVLKAWDAVAKKHGGSGCDLGVVNEIVSERRIRSHGDAIHHLKLSETVVRPVSLRQIRMEGAIYQARSH